MSDKNKEIDSKQKKDRKCSAIYLGISAFVLLFGVIYELFSHSVRSVFMEFAFVCPFVLGVILFFILSFTSFSPCDAARRLWHSGVATLTVGSVFRGVIEIYGTDSPYPAVYLVTGATLFAVSVICEIISRIRNK